MAGRRVGHVNNRSIRRGEAPRAGDRPVGSTCPSPSTRPGPDPSPASAAEFKSINCWSWGGGDSQGTVGFVSDWLCSLLHSPGEHLTFDLGLGHAALSHWLCQGQQLVIVKLLQALGLGAQGSVGPSCFTAPTVAWRHACPHPPVAVGALGTAPSRLMLSVQQDLLHVSIVERDRGGHAAPVPIAAEVQLHPGA